MMLNNAKIGKLLVLPISSAEFDNCCFCIKKIIKTAIPLFTKCAIIGNQIFPVK